MMEAAVLLDLFGYPLYWHTPEDRTVASLPDSRNLWDRIWAHRGDLAAIAHTHPGRGLTGPSTTDLTTFDAIEKGLGLGHPLYWLIATDDRLVRVRRVRVDTLGARPQMVWITEEELSLPTTEWLPRLRELSNYGGNNG